MALDPLTALLGVGEKVIERIWPDANKRAEELRRLKEIAQRGDLALMEAHVKLLAGQMEINKAEAAHPSKFIAGWRPFVGWVGGSALAYAAILEPLLRFVATMKGYQGDFPVLDTTITLQVLLGLLGLGGLRSLDKFCGTDTKGIK